MEKSDKHPSRRALIRAAKTNRVPFASHLKDCDFCRALFEQFRAGLAGKAALEHTEPDAAARFAAIPLLQGRRQSAAKRTGAVVFDSWRDVPAAQLRDAGPGLERHLTFEAGDITLSLVMERQPDGCEFVARVYSGGELCSDFVLQVGRKKVATDFSGFFHWLSPRPPRTIRLVSASTQIDFEGISWQAAGK